MECIRPLWPGAGRIARGSRHGNDRFDPGVDDGPFPGRAADRGTRSRLVPQAGFGGRKERSEDPAISGSDAEGDRIGQSSGLKERCMSQSLQQILNSYDDKAPLAEAYTIPAPWYVDARVAELELQTVFRKTWQVIGRIDQV